MHGLIRNKRGADKILSIYWFVVLVIIAGGVIAMAYNFYGSPYDVREIEAGILSDKVADCISSNGMLSNFLYNESGFMEGVKTTFLSDCGISFNVENENGWEKEFQYMIYVSFYNSSDTSNPVFEIKHGNLNFLPECYIKTSSGGNYKKLVKCDEERLYVVDSLGKQYLVKILSGIKKAEKNAAV